MLSYECSLVFDTFTSDPVPDAKTQTKHVLPQLDEGVHTTNPNVCTGAACADVQGTGPVLVQPRHARPHQQQLMRRQLLVLRVQKLRKDEDNSSLNEQRNRVRAFLNSSETLRQNYKGLLCEGKKAPPLNKSVTERF